jgi:hypothetical protein
VDFVGVAQRIQRKLTELEAPVAVVGALALPVYGYARATADLDLLTIDSVQSELVSFLEAQGYETVHVSSGYSNHVHREPLRGRVDVIYVDAQTAAKLFAGARQHEVLKGLVMLVPKPEHLIAMKARAIANDPRRRFQDLADVQALLRCAEVERAEARRYFAMLGLEHLYEQIEQTL